MSHVTISAEVELSLVLAEKELLRDRCRLLGQALLESDTAGKARDERIAELEARLIELEAPAEAGARKKGNG